MPATEFEQHILDTNTALRFQIEARIKEVSKQIEDTTLDKDSRYKAVFERVFWENEKKRYE